MAQRLTEAEKLPRGLEKGGQSGESGPDIGPWCKFSSGYVEDARIGAHENLYLKISNYLKVCPASFSQSTECLIPDFYHELFSGDVQSQQLQQLLI